ncbi:hypothetical protein BGZ74_001027, partial [Mortierella antarctica]
MFHNGPYCVASNGNTLYAVASSGGTADETVILAKSNTAPSSLAALSWTAVASTSQNTLNTVPGRAMDNNVVCHVDSQGVFTLLTISSQLPGKSIEYKPAGYQYNPATNAWTNIIMPAEYKWNLDAGALFEVGVGSSSTLMHIHSYVDRPKDSSFIAVYSPSTRRMAESSTPWVSKGDPSRFAADNGSAYITSYDVGTGTMYLNIGAVTASGAPPASPKVVTLNVTNCDGFSRSYKTAVREGMYYIYCGGQATKVPSWYTYDGTALSAPTGTSRELRVEYGFLPLGPAGSPATWAFMYSILGLYGMPLTGGQSADWETANYLFNVSGSIPGSGSSPGSGSGSGANGRNGEGSKSGGLSTGALAGLISGAAVIVGVTMFVLWRRKRAMSKPVQLKQQPHKEPPNHPIPEPPQHPIPEPPQHPILVPVEQHQKEEPYSHQREEPYPHQKEEPYPEPGPPMTPTVFMPQDATNFLASDAFSWKPVKFVSSVGHQLDFGYSEMTSIAGSPYRNAASLTPTSPQQYPQVQNPAALPINQKAPQMYPAVTAPQFYGEPGQERPVSSQVHSPALQMYPAVTAPQFYGEPSQARPVPSQAHSPALQMYPTATAPQFYGEPSQAYPPPPPPVPTVAAPQDYGLTQAYPPPPQ